MTDHLGLWLAADRLPLAEVASIARSAEAHGLGTLWLAETTGRDPFALLAQLGAETKTLRLATGIASISNRTAPAMKRSAFTLSEQTGSRFTLGLGVSSPQIVELTPGGVYERPVQRMTQYLRDYADVRYTLAPPPDAPPIVLAALGPRMLRLAAVATAGALTYNMPPRHTALAREILGPEPLLCVEQKVILCADGDTARTSARRLIRFYTAAPGYRRAWHSIGHDDDAIDDASDAFIDDVFAWGSADQIRDRLQAHLDAGANQVTVQILDAKDGIARFDFAALEAITSLRLPAPTRVSL